MFDEKYWQHCCYMIMVSSRAASFVNMNKDCQMSQCSQRLQYSVNLLQCVELDFHRDSASALRSCLQNQSSVPGSKLKWHEVVVLKNVFRHCVKHVAMQRRRIAQWHDGLKRSGKAGRLFRATFSKGRPHVENNTVQLLTSLLDVDRRWTAHELAAEVVVCHKTVLHIESSRKLAARWILNEISQVQQWHCNAGLIGPVSKGR